jgi:hypothetical protein
MVSTFKLRCNPTQADSQLYELKARSFDTGTVEQFILWKRDLDKILMGQNVTRPIDKFAMARRVLEGDALATFNEKAYTLGIESEENFKKSMEALASHIFPKYALSNQKAWLRRSDDVRKKPQMSTRTWAARLNEINQMLIEFPPKFNETQMIPKEDFIEVIEYGIPQSWRAKMVEQGFIPIQHTLAEIIEFCEKMEYAEEMIGPIKNKNNSSQGQKGQNAKRIMVISIPCWTKLKESRIALKGQFNSSKRQTEKGKVVMKNKKFSTMSEATKSFLIDLTQTPSFANSISCQLAMMTK